MRNGHWETKPLFWEVLAYAILAKIEACNWNTLLYLKSHNIDQLKTMKINLSIEKLLMRMQHGWEKTGNNL